MIAHFGDIGPTENARVVGGYALHCRAPNLAINLRAEYETLDGGDLPWLDLIEAQGSGVYQVISSTFAVAAIAASSSINAVSCSSARTTKRFPLSRCASAMRDARFGFCPS